MISICQPDKVRDEWVVRLQTLVQTVKAWATELGWVSRQIEITLSDSQLGKYPAPALLLQEDAVRILLEPIARSAPGAEGVVDLYLMPEYDDIASLYFYQENWHVHFMFPALSSVATTREADAKVLSKETLSEVLEALKQNASQ